MHLFPLTASLSTVPAPVWLFAALVASQGSGSQGVSVAWEAPPGCPGQTVLRRQVEALLGRSLSAPFHRRVDVRGTVKRVDDRFTLEITGVAEGAPFQRDLVDVSCSALTEAAALILALAIDPSAVGAPLPPQPDRSLDPPHPIKPPREEPLPEEPLPKEPLPAEPPPPLEPPPSVASARSGPRLPFGIPWPRLGVFVEGALAGRVRPGIGGSVAVGWAVFWRYFRVEGHAAYGFGRGRPAPAGRLDVSLISVSGRACPTIPVSGLEVPLCLGLEGGQIRFDPVEIPGAEPGRGFWGAAVVSGGLAWAPLEALAVRARAEAIVSVFRPAYETAATGEIHRPSLLAGRGILGLEVRFF